jgi:predicted transposase YbfD/YdcC
MLHQYVSTRITEELPFSPTEQQSQLIDLLGQFLMSDASEKVFLLKGYAGTGKTSVVSALVRAMNSLKQKTILLAPTGRAAKVIAGYSGFPAFTIHKRIYRQKSMAEYSFQLADNLFRDTLFIADREKWNGNLTVIEILTSTEKKSDGKTTSEQRLYISSLDSSAERLSQITKQHWAIESMHWDLDRNLRQDSIKRKAERAARNLDTIQRMVLALIAVWKNRRKKISDKQKGTAQIIRELAVSFTNVLHFLAQK